MQRVSEKAKKKWEALELKSLSNMGEAAQRRAPHRFEVRSPAAAPAPRHQYDPTLETAMFAAAANFRMTWSIYPATSTFIPCAAPLMAYVNQMDTIMASIRNWSDNCMGWVPPYSQIYFGMLFYIQIFRAMHLSPGSDEPFPLHRFQMVHPFSSLSIPGPLVSFFQNLACFTPDPDTHRFGNVTPSVPPTPGWSRATRYSFPDFSTHLPNLSVYLSRLYSTCAAVNRRGADDLSFAQDVDGPRHLATLFSQPCDNAEHMTLQSPGASLIYAGDLRLWKNAALQMKNMRLPPNLDIKNHDEVTDNWVSALRLDCSFDWFSAVAVMMARYSKFWKNSLSLEECLPNGSAAGAVRCRVIRDSTTIFDGPTWIAQCGNHDSLVHGSAHQVAHYSLLTTPTLMFDAYTALVDIPDLHVQAALTFSYNLHLDKDQRRRAVSGPFWSIRPEAGRVHRVSTLQGVAVSLVEFTTPISDH